ncbi:MAG: PAS domain S-box protein [Spirochaetes bacterium]|jgi:PAS domain S-box-containing protein|nr:PAS domain S-box protein [Spirochaetota bacterium]
MSINYKNNINLKAGPIYSGVPGVSSNRLYGAIFNSTPLAIFVVNRNFQIQDANTKFKILYPRYESGKNDFCYKIIPQNECNMPCPDCLVRKTFISGVTTSKEEKFIREDGVSYYRKEVTPIFSENGEITSVMETIEDITTRVESEQKLENYNRELELAISERITEQRQKEKKLTVLVNTVNEIKSAHNISESIDKIIGGFRELNANSIAFALLDGEEICLTRVYPQDVLVKLNTIFHLDISQLRVNQKRNPENPFVRTALLGKPVVISGGNEIFSFFKSCFSGSFDHEIAEASYLFRNQSQVIFPLKTKDMSVGSIALFSETVTLEQNFEYFSFLASSAAVEISRQINSEKLLKSELKYRNLVENTRDMIILCSSDGIIRYSNRIFTELTGISVKQKKNRSIYSLFQGTYRDRIKEAISSSLFKGITTGPVELKMKTPGNKELWTEMIINTEPERIQGFQIVGRDITHRKNMEILVGNMSEFQEKILQNDLIGIITMDISGKITSWNKGAAHILGFSPEETLQKNMSAFIIMEDSESYGQFVKRDIKTSAQTSRELKFRKKNGEAVSVMYVESTLKDEESMSMAVIGFFFDITEKAHLEEKWKELTLRLQQAQLITIVSLAKLAEYRDIETGHHLERIMKYTGLLANELSGFKEYKSYISEEYILDLVNSCPLHDIGKVGIPDQVLHKPGKLTSEEFEIIKTHTIIGGDTLAEAEKKMQGRSYLNLGKEIAYYHHERWDGNGYPQGLKGKQIPLSARIVAVADVYDALISKRPYKEPFPHDTAMNIITESSGTHFDETVVKALNHCGNAFFDLKNSYIQ